MMIPAQIQIQQRRIHPLHAQSYPYTPHTQYRHRPRITGVKNGLAVTRNACASLGLAEVKSSPSPISLLFLHLSSTFPVYRPVLHPLALWDCHGSLGSTQEEKGEKKRRHSSGHSFFFCLVRSRIAYPRVSSRYSLFRLQSPPSLPRNLSPIAAGVRPLSLPPCC